MLAIRHAEIRHDRPLSAAEHAAVAAHIARNGVTRCPPCTFSEAGDPTAAKAREASARAAKNRLASARMRQTRAAIRARQAEVERMSRAGIRRETIAAALGVSTETVRLDARLLRREGRL